MATPPALSMVSPYSNTGTAFGLESDVSSAGSPCGDETDSSRVGNDHFNFCGTSDYTLSLEYLDMLAQQYQQGGADTSGRRLSQGSAISSAMQFQPQLKAPNAKRKKRDAVQLARCREHSARSRERRKAEREALDNFVVVKTEECDHLKGRIRTLEAEVQCLKQLMVQNAIFLQQQALSNPSVIMPALAALAQVQAMSVFQAPQAVPCRRDSKGFAPICPRPLTTSPGVETR